MLQYGTARYVGYAAPYTPFRRNRVAIAYRVASSLPSSRHYSRPAPLQCAARLFPTGIR